MGWTLHVLYPDGVYKKITAMHYTSTVFSRDTCLAAGLCAWITEGTDGDR
jgi:hypothetical protein